MKRTISGLTTPATNIKEHLRSMLVFSIRKIYTAILLFLLVCFWVSCKVEVDPPIAKPTTRSVFNNNSTATAAQLAIYSKMSTENATQIDLLTGYSADEFINYYTTDPTYTDLYSNNLIASLNQDFGGNYYWGSAYNYIYQENAILENLELSTDVSAKVKKQLQGEAYFMRAWFYFHLVNEYGDVPLIVSTDYTSNSVLPRASKESVYQQMFGDLTKAGSLLNNNYVDLTDTTTTIEKVRPTTWAVNALLSRIYLYHKEYDKAEQQATILLGNAAYGLDSLNGVFIKNSKEAIFQLMADPAKGAVPEGRNFVMISVPIAGNLNSNSIGPQLLNAFEPSDLRRQKWIASFTSGAATWYFNNKYKRGANAPIPSNEYSMMLRLGEQFLIRAEARTQQDNLSGAISDLNAIRQRANLPNYSGALNKDAVLAAIWHERQVELFGEGHRWFDLKRTGQIDAVMTIVTPQKSGGNVWKSYQQLYPIPVADMQINHSLVQNAGY